MKINKSAILITLCAAMIMASGEGLMAQSPDAGSGGANLSNLEPSDDYRPDGYYEPYDFLFVKTQPAGQPQQPASPQDFPMPQPQPQESQPAVMTAPPAAPPVYEPPAFNVPEPPDFNGQVSQPAASTGQPVLTNIHPDDLKAIAAENSAQQQQPQPNRSPAAQPVPQQAQQPAKNPPQPSQVTTPASSDILKLYVKFKKPMRYQLKDEIFSKKLDFIITGSSIPEPGWEEIFGAIKKYYNDVVTNTLKAPMTDEEFERINSVLITYINGYAGAGGNPCESAIVKYKNQYFAFLGPFTRELQNLSMRSENSEERYKLLRLLGGDIIKIVSDKLLIFSLKPLSYCVSEIMREVGNGEYYKIEVLFRVMTSADTPVRNLVRPFFQLLKSKISETFNSEKNPVIRNNFSKAYEMLNKIK